MEPNDHQVQYNRGSSQRKAGIIELGTNDAILDQNKLLTQTVEELTKKLSKLMQQLKEMQKVPSKPSKVTYYELCIGDHPTGFCPPANEEVNYMGNQHRKGTYQGSQGYQRGHNANYGQGQRQEEGSSNRHNPYQNVNINPPQPYKISKIGGYFGTIHAIAYC